MNWKGMLSFGALGLGSLVVLMLVAARLFLVLNPVLGLFGGGDVNGVKAWQAKVQSEGERKAERYRTVRAIGLDTRYTIHPLFGDTRERLFVHQDFETVEIRLAEQYEKRSDPLEAHSYTRYLADLAALRTEDNPAAHLAVVDAWVAAHPDSYRARIVRGRYLISYAWYHRGTGLWNTVANESRRDFVAQLEAAREELERAHTMEPGDPSASDALIAVAMGLSLGREAIDNYYNRALKADPIHLMARYRKMTALQPKWGGSWEDVDEVIAECEANSKAFPLLLIVKRDAQKAMEDRSPAHKAALASDAIKREWAETYLMQLERNPVDPVLMANAAYYLHESREFEGAAHFFRKLGDHFYEGSNFEDLLQYNDYRGNAYAAVAMEVNGPERRALVEEALAVAPNHYYTNYLFGRELLDKGDYDRARWHFEVSRDAYPGYVWSTYRLAEVAERTNQREEALRWAREVLELNPNEQQRGAAQALIRRNER